MSRRIVAELLAYRAAVAELPLNASLGTDPEGAVLVVPDLAAVRRAIERGAAAVVVADVARATSKEAEGLAASRVPIVLARPRLRADVADSVRAPADPPRHIVADVVAAPRARTAAVADAVGWIRILAGGAPKARAADPTGVAVIDGPRGEAIALTVAASADREARFRVEALGTARVMIAADDTRRDVDVTTTTFSGALRAPRRWETPERLALRRALDALGGEHVRDLADLAADLRVTEAILA